ncbi:diguanylate cyclase [Paenibacillus sp. H1-7]|uniref:GGDEF domain-containing protein n=1 Tax=Paenibacillus sp. H1-7 TaxID=2282849 RepID=UPI001EF7A347|nr:diguanylate cyclase [Paenibacillus sp. H1-7]ULL18422.1 diguanylate cyclase [Paenibacillus sp. H1-7]
MYYISFTHACTLIALSYIALKLKNRLFMERYETLSASLLTGLACIIIMLQPFPTDGLVTDLRFAPIVMAGLRFGPIVSLLSTLLPSFYIIQIGEVHGFVRIAQELILPAIVSSLFHRKENESGYAMIPFIDGIKVCVMLAAIRFIIQTYMKLDFSLLAIASHLITLVLSILAVLVLIVMYNDDNRSWILQRRFELQANQDGLTGLPNLRSFMSIAQNTIRQRPLSIMMIDIDNFKYYNDTYGHLQGDLLLCEVGQLLRTTIHESDYAARYGGEEFIIMSHTVDTDRLKQYALQLCDTIARHHSQVRSDSAVITISIGISVAFGYQDELLRVISEADEALYVSKREGKNRFTIYSDDIPFTANNA